VTGGADVIEEVDLATAANPFASYAPFEFDNLRLRRRTLVGFRRSLVGRHRQHPLIDVRLYVGHSLTAEEVSAIIAANFTIQGDAEVTNTLIAADVLLTNPVDARRRRRQCGCAGVLVNGLRLPQLGSREHPPQF